MAAQRLKGKLYLDPTDLSAHSTDYGGKNLGSFSQLYFMPNRKLVSTQALETGFPDQYFVRNGISLVGVNFREPNPDLMSILFGAGVNGSGFPTVSMPGNQPTGTLVSAHKLLFVPSYRDTEQSFLFYSVVAQLEPTQQIRASALRETTYPVIFEAGPDASDRILDIKLISDMSL